MSLLSCPLLSPSSRLVSSRLPGPLPARLPYLLFSLIWSACRSPRPPSPRSSLPDSPARSARVTPVDAPSPPSYPGRCRSQLRLDSIGHFEELVGAFALSSSLSEFGVPHSSTAGSTLIVGRGRQPDFYTCRQGPEKERRRRHGASGRGHTRTDGRTHRQTDRQRGKSGG